MKSREGKARVQINAVKPTDKCHACGEEGHWSRDCLNKGDLPSYHGKSKASQKASDAGPPAEACQYCQKNHRSSDCYEAKKKMREAGFVTSGRGGSASKSKRKTQDSKKGAGQPSRGKGRGRGRGKAKGAPGREKIHTVDIGSEENALPPHPMRVEEESSDDEGDGQAGASSSFQ